jgi:hypothetical protein
MGITNRLFGKQKNTGDRIKQAAIWLLVIPQAVAGWLVILRYYDLMAHGGPVRFMDASERFWWETGAIALVLVLLVQIAYVWTLRGVYHRVEHVKETIIKEYDGGEFEEGNEQEVEIPTWHTAHNGRVSETVIIKESVNAQKLMHWIHEHPPQTSSQASKILKAIQQQKIDTTKEPWKKIYGDVLNARKKLENRENKEKKQALASTSPIPFLDEEKVHM